MINNKKIGNFKVHPIGIGTWGVGGWFQADDKNDKKHVDTNLASVDFKLSEEDVILLNE